MKSLITLLCVISLALAEQSPVFLWGVNSEPKPSLASVSQSEFAEIIESVKGESSLIVFLEKGLNNKDFSCTNSITAKSCFARLQGVTGKNFYASVENPIAALQNIKGRHVYNSVDSNGKLQSPLEPEKGDVIFVTFEDDEKTERLSSLEFHDSIIASIVSQVGNKNVFYMYTSAPSSSYSTALKRDRRETAATSSGYIFRSGANLLLFFSSLTVENSNDASSTPLVVNGMEVTVSNATALSVTLTSSPSLSFDITLSGGYFFMTNVKWNNIAFRSTDVYSPTDFSYFCGNLTLYGVGTADEPSTYTLKWNSLQFQAPFGYTKDESFVFSDPWHCVGFFTGSILSGLLIVALLLTITFVGVCWMMDINTMDRFDDPKGKTITINASE